MDSKIRAAASLPTLTGEDRVALAAALKSWKGKTLGRATAVFAGLVLLIGLAGLTGWKVRHLRPALSPLWLDWLLLIGVPSLVIVAQLWTERQAARTRLAIQDLASQRAEIPNESFRIGPYLDTAADRDDFNRPDGAHQLVLQWLQRTEAVPLYLTGTSGSGKSSLLNAFVLPALRAQGWTVAPIRASDDMETALIEALPGDGWGQIEAMRDRIAEAARRAEGPLLLVGDQFEAFLTQAPPARLRAFAELVADLEARPVPKLKLLVVLGGDFTAELSAAGLPAPFHGANTVRITSFPVDTARSLLMNAKAGLPDRLLDQLLAGSVELDETRVTVSLTTLNTLGFIVKRRQLTELAPNGAGQLVHDYIAHVADGSVIRDRSRPVLKGLISAKATTRARSETDLSSETALCVPEVRAVLTALTAAGLVRPLSQGYWELSHDFLAAAVAAFLNTPPPEVWRRARSFWR